MLSENEETIVRPLSAPLTSQQRRLWLLQRHCGREFRNVFGCMFKGGREVVRLRSALSFVLSRHDILKFFYPVQTGEEFPVPRHEPGYEPDFQAIDCSASSEDEQKRELERVYEELKVGELSLGTRPFLRFVLLRFSEEHSHLIGCIPILNADRKSVIRLLSELEEVYWSQDMGVGRFSVPQFQDIVSWAIQEATDSASEHGESFWRSYLADTPWPVPLPLEKPDTKVDGAFEASERFYLPTSGGEEFTQKAGELRESIKAELIAAILAWSARTSGKEDVCVGLAFSGRPYEELSDMIGPFERYIPLVSRIEKGMTLGGLKKAVAEKWKELAEYEDWFRWELADRSMPAAPFQLCIEFTEDQAQVAQTGRLVRVTRFLSENEGEAIRVVGVTSGERPFVDVFFDPKQFSALAIRQLCRHWERLLELTVREPRVPIADAQFLGEEESSALRSVSDIPSAWSAHGRKVHQIISEQTYCRPDVVAVIEGEFELSYGGLERCARSLARRLSARVRTGPELLIGIQMATCWEVQVAILAILKTGSAYVPIGLDWPQERIEAVARDAGLTAVLTAERQPVDTFLEGVEYIECGEGVWSDLVDGGVAEVALEQENVAYVLYTSGTSGTPKGAMITHGGFADYLCWAASYYQIEQSRGAVVHSPLTFDFTLTCLLAPLLVGRCVYIARANTPLEELAETLSYLDEVSAVKLTPTSVDPLMRLFELRGSSCRVGCIIVGGEALWGNKALRKLTQACGADIVNEYGPTECVVGCCIYRLGPNDVTEGIIPIGRAIPTARLSVLRENGAAAETWCEGEIYIGGSGVARGYLNRPALTAAAFLPDASVSLGGRVYRTGDIAKYLSNGEIVYLSRRDTQVKIRGYRVELTEVEAAIRRDESVADCAVTVLEKTDSHAQLIAFVVLHRDARVEMSDLRGNLLNVLPEYMVPTALYPMGALPSTANGKMDVAALKDSLAKFAQNQKRLIPPRTEAERVLVELWKELLECDSISVDDNFFELGGDSILSIQFLARSHQLGLRLGPKDMRHPTIMRLAEAAQAVAKPTEVEEGEFTGDIPLTPIQREFFAWKFEVPQHYNQSVLFQIPRQWNAAQLEKALGVIVETHDVFQIGFVKGAEEYRQIHSRPGAAKILRVIDLSAVPPGERKMRVNEAALQAQQSLSLETPPLLRAVLFQEVAETGHQLYIVAHHLIIDHISWRILIEDLELSLQQIARGEPLALSGNRASYQMWARRLEHRATALTEEEKKYWSTAQWRGALPFPVDEPAGLASNLVSHEETASLALPAEQTEFLMRAANRAYHTRTLDLLVAAYALAYARWSGQRTMTLGMESHGRDAALEGIDVTRTIGWFTALYPVFLSLPASSDLGRSIKEIKEQLRAVPNHGLGYGLLKHAPMRSEGWGERAAEPTDVVFNFLGDVGQTLARDTQFQLIPKNPAPNRARQNRRTHLLEINSYVLEGRLRTQFTFGRSVHWTASIEKLASEFDTQLQLLLRHCRDCSGSNYTPADFPLVHLSPETLDQIVKLYPGVEDIYPLSPTQKGILFHSMHEANSAPYLVQLCVELSGELNEQAFEESWRRLLGRHSVLRTCFLWEALNEPVQLVDRAPPFVFTHLDWTGGTGQDPRSRLSDWLDTQRRETQDLSKLPLTRFALFRLAENRYYFVWTFHHILLDGWSTSNLLREALSLYENLHHKTDSEMRPAYPFRDYIEWLESRDGEAASRYWKRRLDGFDSPTALLLSPAQPMTAAAPEVHRERALTIEPSRGTKLLRLAARLRVTLNTVMQGAWGLVLSRYAQTDDVVFGVTVSGRPYDLSDIENRVGLFINTLPMRIRVKGAAQLGTYLTEVNHQLQEMMEYEYSSLIEIQRLCALPERMKLFESILVFENYPTNFDFGFFKKKLKIEATWTGEKTNYPLTLVIAASEESVSIKLVYSSTAIDDDSAQQLLSHLSDTLSWMGSVENECLGRFAESWEQKPLACARLSTTSRAWALPIHQRFEQKAQETPDAIAVVDGFARSSYAAVNYQANQLAHFLLSRGARPGTYVALCLDRSVHMIVALMAILKTGAAYLPIDSRFPGKRIRLMATDADLILVDLTSRRHFAPDKRVIDVEERRGEIGLLSPSNPENRSVTCEDVAYLMYTSGSSGQPKGTLVTHGNVMSLLSSTDELYSFAGSECWTFFHSIAFDFSVWEVFGALLTGGQLVVTPYWMARSPAEFAELLRREHVTILSQTPSAFQQLLAIGGLTEQARSVLSLRWVVFGGEALHLEPLADYRDALAECGVRLLNMYGITETTVHVTHRILQVKERVDRRSLIGPALPHLQTYLLDQFLVPVPRGVRGEIFVGGRGVALGYINSPGLTAERFVPDPFGNSPGARLYRSGDLGRLIGRDDMEYLGRGDKQVKIRGFRIEVEEIRHHINRCDGVRDALIRPTQDHAGDLILIAYIIPTRPDFSAVELRRSLREQLPEHMVPAIIELIDRFPLTGNGKIDFSALPASHRTVNRAGPSFVPPQTWEQEVIADIWCDALGLKTVSLHDDFFNVGGDSIKALRVVGRLRSFGFRASIELLFNHPTIAALSRVVSGTRDGNSREDLLPEAKIADQIRGILPVDVQDVYPVSQLQLGMLFHSAHEGVKSAAYHNVSVFRLRGAFDETRFRNAVEISLARHPVLRTSFDLESHAIPVQIIHRGVTAPISIDRIEASTDGEQKDFIEDWLAAEKMALFPYAFAPLVRFKVIVCGPETFYLGLTEHHAILDGWSVASLLTELLEHYAQGRAPEPVPLYSREQNVFRSFVLLEQQTLASAEQRTFWTNYLEDCLPPRLPVLPATSDQAPGNHRVEKKRIRVDGELTQYLRQLAHRIQVPLKSVLLSAHLEVLGFFTNSEEVVTGLITHGRPDCEGGEAGLGLFLNTLPFRAKRTRSSRAQWIKSVFEEERHLLPYRRFPLAAMRDASGRKPRLETAFNYVNFHIYETVAARTDLAVVDTYVHEETNFDLLTNFGVLSGTAELDITLSYNTAKFDARQIDALFSYYLKALRMLVEDADSVGEPGRLLSCDEVQSDLVRSRQRQYAGGFSTLQELLEDVMRTSERDRIAVIDGEIHLTYGKLFERIETQARALVHRGIGPEETVAVLLEKSLEWVIALLAVLRAGGVYVPLDVNDPTERLNYIIKNSRAKWVMVDDRTSKTLTGTEAPLWNITQAIPCSTRPEGSAQSAVVLPENLAYVIYTSGTTGKPKGVAMAHSGILNLINWHAHDLPATDVRILQYASPAFDVSVQEVLSCITGRSALVIVKDAVRKDFVSLSQLLRQEQVQWIFAPYTVLKALSTASRSAQIDTPALDTVINAGESLILDRELAEFVRGTGKGRLLNQYGPTESHVVTSGTTNIERLRDPRLPSIGYPIDNTSILILDDRGNRLPAGTRGELYISSKGMARGYHHAPWVTAEKFLPDGLSGAPAGARFFKTGDSGYRADDDEIWFLGRLDQQVKLRGYRIELDEIRQAFLEHPSICDAVVTLDGTRQELCAYFVANRPMMDVSELIQGIRQKLPAYMAPSRVLQLDALPLTKNGKIDFRSLPAIDPSRSVAESADLPRDELEIRLAALWNEILDTAQNFSRNHDFMDCGGNSLSLLNLQLKIQKRFGTPVSIAKLGRNSSLAKMADYLKQQISAQVVA